LKGSASSANINGIAPDGAYECGECHAAYFAGHTAHTSSTHAILRRSTDLSGTDTCETCHGVGGTSNPTKFTNAWNDGSANDIFALHTGTCTFCHNSTRNNTTDPGTVNPTYGSVAAVISSGTASIGCLDCHYDRSAGHGGHDFNDTKIANNSNCTTGNCHGGGTAHPFVIHNVYDATVNPSGTNDCSICHLNAPGGGGALIPYLETNWTHGGDCTQCHFTSGTSAGHHGYLTNTSNRTTGPAQSGNCTECHTDPRPAAGNRVIQAMTCSECHVQMNGSTMEIVAITIAKEGSAQATGDDSGNTYTPITTANGFSSNHTFPNSGGVINNYGVCLECHGHTGKSGYTSAPRMFPYHALPKPGAYSSTDNTIGGDGWNNSLGNFGMARFRGDQNWNTGATDSYFPVGKGRLNIGYAQHSLAAHATQDTSYKAPNQSAPDTYMTMNAGISFGTVTHPTNNHTYFIPNFDPICTAANGCDNITSASVSVAGSRPETSWSVSATSSTGATLHVIYGGREIGSFSSGGTFTLNVAEEYTSRKYQNLIPMDIFNSEHGGPVWVVSEDGGAANAGTWPGLDWANLDNVQTGLSYPGTDWPQQ